MKSLARQITETDYLPHRGTVALLAVIALPGCPQRHDEVHGEGSGHFLSMTLPMGRADCESAEAELIRLYGKPTQGGSGQIRVAFSGAMLVLRQLPR